MCEGCRPPRGGARRVEMLQQAPLLRGVTAAPLMPLVWVQKRSFPDNAASIQSKKPQPESSRRRGDRPASAQRQMARAVDSLRNQKRRRVTSLSAVALHQRCRRLETAVGRHGRKPHLGGHARCAWHRSVCSVRGDAVDPNHLGGRGALNGAALAFGGVSGDYFRRLSESIAEALS